MNIWNIALKGIKSEMRDRRTLVLMLIFPIVLMLILGSALSNAFSSSLTVEEMKLVYKNAATNTGIVEAWGGFTQAIQQEGVVLVPAGAETDGVEEVRTDKATAYAVVRDDGIQFYGSSKHTIESNILQGMLTAFSDQYNLVTSAMQAGPAAAQAILQQQAEAASTGGFVHETSLTADRKAGSMDYYALVMSTMIAFYATMSASFLIRGERLRKTAIRLMAAPLGKGELFIGKVLGNTIINFLCVVVVVLFSKYVFQADWGDHMGVVLAMLLTEVMLAVSIGLGVSFLLNDSAATPVLMIIAQAASFFGGAYFPISEMDGFMGGVVSLSPLRWMNEGLMKVIYSGDVQAALPVVGLNLGIAALFLIFSAISMRRREAL